MQLENAGQRNLPGQVCRVVLEAGPLLIDAIEERLAMSPHQAGAVVRNLCMEKILRRDDDRVSVIDKKQAKFLAERSTPLPEPDPEPSLAPERQAKCPTRIVLPTEIKIDKGVPLPIPIRAKIAQPLPLERLQVGDSFALDIPDGVDHRRINNKLRWSARDYMREHPQFRFAIRRDLEAKQYRMWRIEDDAPQRARVGKKRGAA